jgi:spore germination cell wall hydrolase CwlJ-like protein
LLIFRLLDPLAGFDDTVQKLQEALVQKGFLTDHDVSGIYDQRTYEAVLRFQDAQDLLVDGEIGPETGRLLLGDAWDAVKAQSDAGDDVPVTSDRDLLTVARTVFGEARGEPTQGKEAVASVILNRSRSGRYPSNIADVCLQAFQFSCWNKNDPNRPKMLALKPKSDKDFDECLAAADRVIRGLVPDRTDGALHYHTKAVKPKWVAASPKARVSAIIGNHIFYTGVR